MTKEKENFGGMTDEQLKEAYRARQAHGQKIIKLKAEYRFELLKARLAAIKMANVLLERGAAGEITGDAIDAMRETLKDARETLGVVKHKKIRATGQGIPSDLNKAADEVLGND